MTDCVEDAAGDGAAPESEAKEDDELEPETAEDDEDELKVEAARSPRSNPATP